MTHHNSLLQWSALLIIANSFNMVSSFSVASSSTRISSTARIDSDSTLITHSDETPHHSPDTSSLSHLVKTEEDDSDNSSHPTAHLTGSSAAVTDTSSHHSQDHSPATSSSSSNHSSSTGIDTSSTDNSSSESMEDEESGLPKSIASDRERKGLPDFLMGAALKEVNTYLGIVHNMSLTRKEMEEEKRTWAKKQPPLVKVGRCGFLKMIFGPIFKNQLQHPEPRSDAICNAREGPVQDEGNIPTEAVRARSPLPHQRCLRPGEAGTEGRG